MKRQDMDIQHKILVTVSKKMGTPARILIRWWKEKIWLSKEREREFPPYFPAHICNVFSQWAPKSCVCVCVCATWILQNSLDFVMFWQCLHVLAMLHCQCVYVQNPSDLVFPMFMWSHILDNAQNPSDLVFFSNVCFWSHILESNVTVQCSHSNAVLTYFDALRPGQT